MVNALMYQDISRSIGPILTYFIKISLKIHPEGPKFDLTILKLQENCRELNSTVFFCFFITTIC